MLRQAPSPLSPPRPVLQKNYATRRCVSASELTDICDVAQQAPSTACTCKTPKRDRCIATEISSVILLDCSHRTYQPSNIVILLDCSHRTCHEPTETMHWQVRQLRKEALSARREWRQLLMAHPGIQADGEIQSVVRENQHLLAAIGADKKSVTSGGYSGPQLWSMYKKTSDELQKVCNSSMYKKTSDELSSKGRLLSVTLSLHSLHQQMSLTHTGRQSSSSVSYLS